MARAPEYDAPPAAFPVTAADIADGAIITSKIADGAITTAKLASSLSPDYVETIDTTTSTPTSLALVASIVATAGTRLIEWSYDVQANGGLNRAAECRVLLDDDSEVTVASGSTSGASVRVAGLGLGPYYRSTGSAAIVPNDATGVMAGRSIKEVRAYCQSSGSSTAVKIYLRAREVAV